MESSFIQNPRTMRGSIATTLSRSLPFARCFSGDLDFRSDDDYDGGSFMSSCGDYAYSRSFVVLDVMWNLAFVLLSMLVLLCTAREKPSCPLRIWIGGYAVQCLVHVGSVLREYRRQGNYDGGAQTSQNCGSILKRLETMNPIASSFWWVIGFYWIVTGGPALLQESPRLYWLAVVFLSLDVFFMLFCIGMAFLVFIAFFCCIPFVAIAYAMTIREGASEDDIRLLPRYRFHQVSSSRLFKWDFDPEDSLAVELEGRNCANQMPLHPGDSECCICLTRYVEGAELCCLPCNHHFHFGCISRWLRINATCPLCKFNILKGDTLV